VYTRRTSTHNTGLAIIIYLYVRRKTCKIKFRFRRPVKSKNNMYDIGDFWNKNAHDTHIRYIGNGQTRFRMAIVFPTKLCHGYIPPYACAHAATTVHCEREAKPLLRSCAICDNYRLKKKRECNDILRAL